VKHVKQPKRHIVLDDFEWRALVKGLSETMTDKQLETLEKYDEAMNEMHSLTEVEAFSYGFRLGIRLMIEAGVPLIKETT